MNTAELTTALRTHDQLEGAKVYTGMFAFASGLGVLFIAFAQLFPQHIQHPGFEPLILFLSIASACFAYVRHQKAKTLRRNLESYPPLNTLQSAYRYVDMEQVTVQEVGADLPSTTLWAKEPRVWVECDPRWETRPQDKRMILTTGTRYGRRILAWDFVPEDVDEYANLRLQFEVAADDYNHGVLNSYLLEADHQGPRQLPMTANEVEQIRQAMQMITMSPRVF